ncbi:MAG TPA: hypothetical protein VFZ28_18125 [Burkholderiaceae bacterium]|nr:hypothetical protein [Burkholderiaceae bacterium]
MEHRYFETRGEAAADRAHCWGCINRSFFGELGVQCLDPGPFDAAMAAYEVGLFKSHYGVSPRDFRQQALAAPVSPAPRDH